MATHVRIGAVDPGKVNPAVWMGILDIETGKITTDWGAAGTDITSDIAGAKEKPTICEVGTRIGELMVDKCTELGITDLEGVVVETPATFTGKGCFVNVGAAVGAGATYGYLCGHGMTNVRMSHSRTKSRAMEYFAARMQIELETHETGITKAKARLVNKRNAKRVVDELLRYSGDAKGTDLLQRHKDKKDDLADAILLACGLGLDLRKPKTRTKKAAIKK